MLLLDVNTDSVVKFSAKLEMVNKSAFPRAVKNALNSAAFDVKKRTLQDSARKHFVSRQQNFFKANSRVQMASGMIVGEMESTIGMIDLGGNNYAVDDLKQQEEGGKIGGKSLTPLEPSRIGKSYKKRVRLENRLSKIRNVITVKKTLNIFQASVMTGRGGYVLSEKGILFRVDSTQSRRPELTALYSYKRGRNITIKGTHFMREAATTSAGRIERFYMVSANREFKRYLK